MVYNYLGFNQEKLINHGIDALDILIIKYIVDDINLGLNVYIDDESAYSITPEGEIYSELPILGFRNVTDITSKIQRLVEKGLLKRIYVNKPNMVCYVYGPGPEYENVVYKTY